jgi:hypothetical protein
MQVTTCKMQVTGWWWLEKKLPEWALLQIFKAKRAAGAYWNATRLLKELDELLSLHEKCRISLVMAEIHAETKISRGVIVCKVAEK